MTLPFAARTDFPLFPTNGAEVRLRFVDAQNRPLGVAAPPLRLDAPMTFVAPQNAAAFRGEIWQGGFRPGSFGQLPAP